MLSVIDDAMPGVPLFAASGMLASRGLAVPASPRLEAVGPALRPERAGYEAMRLVLDAVAEGGRDRRRVIAAALRLGRRIANGELALYKPGADGRLERIDARFSPR